MRISAKSWAAYVDKLSRINTTAANMMQAYVDANGIEDAEALIDYAHALVTKYGEASGALACEMYDAIAVASGKALPAAEMAALPERWETAKAVQGTIKNKDNTVPATVGRMVKQEAADTTLQNAERDQAYFAWIPTGDTCAFCLTLASRGWQKMSKRALKNGHAEHIHANCDCEYAISFDKNPQVEGYDPQRYREIYDNAEGSTPREKIDAIRRVQYAAQTGKTAALAKSKKLEIAGVPVERNEILFSFSNGASGTTPQRAAIEYKLQDGTRFVFPEVYDPALQTMTPEKAIELWQEVPEEVRAKAQKTIAFVDYENPMDSYWRKQYKYFTRSYATGGDEITFYRYEAAHKDEYVIRSYCHEAGHFVDKTNASAGVWYSDAKEWTDAMRDDMITSGKASPTAYGENSNAEDFAESVAEYIRDWTRFRKDFPKRAEILDVLFGIGH